MRDACNDGEAVGPFLSMNAARNLPWLRVDGKRLDLSTMYRMARRPKRGRVLRTAYLGGRVVTTEVWLKEYVEGAAADETPRPEETRAPSRRARAMRQAEQELAGAGI